MERPRDKLRGEILRAVSRSFYLSIRLLPEAVREPVALAYLLARATDTIADTTQVARETRRAELAALAEVIAERASAENLPGIAQRFSRLQANAAERALIERLPDCLAWLRALPADDQSDIRAVLAQINEGQMLDVERFGDATSLRALATTAELERYTYLVAGCVGEFWTRVCARRLADFADRPVEEMIRLGTEYGKGLQLTNIIRDLGADLRAGRCYLPTEQLSAVGVTPAQLLQKPEVVGELVTPWLDRAAVGLEAGVEYSRALRSRRVRFATVLPALIGARTVARLRDRPAAIVSQRVKIPRREVYGLILSHALRGIPPRP